MRIGIIGGGVLGTAIARGLTEYVDDVLVHDIEPRRGNAGWSDAVQANIVFVCLPTPSDSDGRLDTGELDKFFGRLHVYQQQSDHPEPLVVIRSTVPVGYTDTVRRSTGVSVVHNPEFLTARCAIADYQIPTRHLIGIPRHGSGVSHGRLVQLYQARFPGTPIRVMQARQSELVKLATNAFFATKVMFFNGLRLLCEDQVDYEEVRKALLADGRLAASHTQVPGPDGWFGYGGACLPKDSAEFAAMLADGEAAYSEHTAALHGLHAWLEQMLQANRTLRGTQMGQQDSEGVCGEADSPETGR